MHLLNKVYIIEESLVEENIKLAENTFLLKVKAEEIAQKAYPGQFIKIRTNGAAAFPLLDRPLSIHNIINKKYLKLLYRTVGPATLSLSTLKKGETVKITGPLGSHLLNYIKKQENPSLYLVGGGVGLAPLAMVYNYLDNNKLKLFYGERLKNLQVDEKWLASWANNYIATVEDGLGYGEKGLITKVLRKALENEKRAIFTCGPKPMLQAVVNLASEFEVPVWVSLEERMACGFGICLSCSIPLKNGERFRACQEGPVYNGQLIDWEA